MKQNTSYISTPEFLSGIISLAADNAKDLALPKLNATEDLVDLYTTATMIGIPFLGTVDGDKKVTGISFVRTAEGLRIAYAYSEIDDKGNVTESNKRGSYINVSDDIEKFVSNLEKEIKERIG